MLSKLFTLILLFHSFAAGQILENINSYYGDKWNGLIPHLQPFNTTDYYGSGDVNCDTKVDSKDIAALQMILNGGSNPNIRADVNGDEEITDADLQILKGALNGDTLPAWWNVYNDKYKKISWLKKMLAIDKTDEHPYVPGKYVCSHFAMQLFKTFTGLNEFSGIKNTFQTKYNLPVYYVLINPPLQTAHNLNAVLTGEDPLNFGHWLFIEPQNDGLVDLSHYPEGTQITIMPLQHSSIVNFELNSIKEGVLIFFNKSLLLSKPLNTPVCVSNPYIINPYLIEENKIIFEKITDDMERKGKIHIAAIDSFNSCFAKPLTINPSSIILVQGSQTGGTDIIWEECVNDSIYEYFYGNLDYEKSELQNIQKLSFLKENDFYKLEMYVYGSKGYMIWLSNSPDLIYKYIYSKIVDGMWQPPETFEMGKSNYPTDFELGGGADDSFYLFSLIRYPLFTKTIIYASDKNWENPVIRECITVDKVFHINQQFILAENKLPYRSNYLEILKKSEGDWNMSSGYFTGIPVQVLRSKTEDNSYYIAGINGNGTERFICAARMENSKPAEQYHFRDDVVGPNIRISAVLNKNELVIIWQDRPSVILNCIRHTLNVTGVDNASEITGVTLNQNYPNPFNSETIIRYKLDKAASVNLRLYDILGREVKTIVHNNWENAGEHTISFDGKDLSSGIYLYKLTAGAQSFVKTMMMVK